MRLARSIPVPMKLSQLRNRLAEGCRATDRPNSGVAAQTPLPRFLSKTDDASSVAGGGSRVARRRNELLPHTRSARSDCFISQKAREPGAGRSRVCATGGDI